MQFTRVFTILFLGIFLPAVLCQREFMGRRPRGRSSFSSMSRSSRLRSPDNESPFGKSGRGRQSSRLNSRRRPTQRTRSEIIIEFRNNRRQNENTAKEPSRLDNSRNSEFGSRTSSRFDRGRNDFDNRGLSRSSNSRDRMFSQDGLNSDNFVQGTVSGQELQRRNFRNEDNDRFGRPRESGPSNQMNRPFVDNGQSSFQDTASSQNLHVRNQMRMGMNGANAQGQNTHVTNQMRRGINTMNSQSQMQNNHIVSGPVDVNLPSEVVGSVNAFPTAIPANGFGGRNPVGNALNTQNIQNTQNGGFHQNNENIVGLMGQNGGFPQKNGNTVGLIGQNGLNVQSSSANGHNSGISTANQQSSGLPGGTRGINNSPSPGINFGNSLNAGPSVQNVGISGQQANIGQNKAQQGHLANQIVPQNTINTQVHHLNQQTPVVQHLNTQGVNIQHNSNGQPLNQNSQVQTQLQGHTVNQVVQPNQNTISQGLTQASINNNQVNAQLNAATKAFTSSVGNGNHIQTGSISATGAQGPLSPDINNTIERLTNIIATNLSPSGQSNTQSANRSPINSSPSGQVKGGLNTINNSLSGALKPRIEPIEIDYEEILQRAMTNRLLNNLDHNSIIG